MLPYVYRVTKYDPADRDEHGGYIGTEDTVSDHGPVEAAYLQAVAAFTEASGVDHMVIREPTIAGLVHFGREPSVDGHGLAGLFPSGLAGFHDGAHVPVAVGLELVRAMLRDFWARLRTSVAYRKAAILEESPLQNVSRWHRLTDGNLDTVRAGLAPRARLTVWPDLSADVAAVLATLPDDGIVEIVWEDRDGHITSTIADDTQFAELAAQLTDARAIAVLPITEDDRRPLFTAVLPDPDGVLRARWRTTPTASDRDWAFLKTLRRGQTITGTVIEIATFGVTFVDIGGFTAMINIPELSWRPINHPSDVVEVGQQITAEILDVDMAWERVPLSLRALQEDPLVQFTRQIGRTVRGPITKILPFGTFIRIEDRDDGFVGLLRDAEPPEAPGDVLQVGDILTVTIIEVDVAHRRIYLAHEDGRW